MAADVHGFAVGEFGLHISIVSAIGKQLPN